MKIKAKYFGMIAEKIGKTNEVFDVDFNQKMNLKPFFESKYNNLQTLNYKIAVNQELKDFIDFESESVEVALLPPFAGG